MLSILSGYDWHVQITRNHNEATCGHQQDSKYRRNTSVITVLARVTSVLNYNDTNYRFSFGGHSLFTFTRNTLWDTLSK